MIIYILIITCSFWNFRELQYAYFFTFFTLSFFQYLHCIHYLRYFTRNKQDFTTSIGQSLSNGYDDFIVIIMDLYGLSFTHIINLNFVKNIILTKLKLKLLQMQWKLNSFIDGNNTEEKPVFFFFMNGDVNLMKTPLQIYLCVSVCVYVLYALRLN